MLVKVEAATVNPIDLKIQKGILRPFVPHRFPHIPGTDIAGEVVKLGSGTTNFAVGEKVVAWVDIKSGGAFAEYAISHAKHTTSRPPQVSAEDGACLPVAGLAALQSLRDYAGLTLDGNYKGNILITAASGGVGLFAVQIAKIGGAHVTATCGARNADLVRTLGADEVLDYQTSEGAKLLSPSGRWYDAIIHAAPNISWAAFQSVLAPHGKVIHLTPGPKTLAMALKHKLTFSKQKLVPFTMKPYDKDLQLLVELTAEGRLKTVIDSRNPLSEARKAWEKSLEGHATGKIVVTMTSEEPVRPRAHEELAPGAHQINTQGG